MTIQIHKEGSLTQLNPVHTVTCPRCGCNFSFNENDAEITTEPDGRDFMSITCPYTACSNSIVLPARQHPNSRR